MLGRRLKKIMKSNFLEKLPKNEQKAIEEFKDGLIKKLGGNLVLLRLYGSKSRGDWRTDSDIDLLAVVKNKNQTVVGNSGIISKLKYNIMARYNFRVLLSTIVYSLNEYQKRSNPPTSFFYTVNNEGRDLWRNQNLLNQERTR